jgi:hypothetical protein
MVVVVMSNTTICGQGQTTMMPNVRAEPGGLAAVGHHPGSQEDAPGQAAAFELQQPAQVMGTVVLDGFPPSSFRRHLCQHHHWFWRFWIPFSPAASFRKAARWCPGQIEYLHREAVELHA